MSSICFDNSYAALPSQFYSDQMPSPVSAPELIRANTALAACLKIDVDWLKTEEAKQAFAGNVILEGSHPISTVYAGHQFGNWNPQLGDGRAVLLGEVVDEEGDRYDIQLKGAGRTPYSRGGDGLSPLGPVLREYVLSEAMAALGVPTTRSLGAVTTGDKVMRETILPGAVLTRVASSHIRVGTFQYFSAQGDTESIRLLFEHAAKRHYPETLAADNPSLAFLDAVIARQAELIAKWQLLGFIHGVMNTDNMLICGETVDYGPCAFMDSYDPDAVFSSIDRQRRYAYSNQPKIAHWNLSWLAQSLIPLIDENQEAAINKAQEAINSFPDAYHKAYEAGLARKLGFKASCEESNDLGRRLFELMAQHAVDFTLCFRKLADVGAPDSEKEIPDELFQFPSSFDSWLKEWSSIAEQAGMSWPDHIERSVEMRLANPAFIPRNHLVEEAIAAGEKNQDFERFHALVDVLAKPYGFGGDKLAYANAKYAKPPNESQRVYQTFCGT